MQLHPPESDLSSPAPEAEAEGRPSASLAWRRRLLWSIGVIGLLIVIGLVLPLISANQYRGKIAESMSKSLGRPVHLDNVSLHLLPVPGFTLQNLVVSEDPAFGAEPTIRANTVEATLRLSSLWRHPVEFSTVRFVEPSVNLVRNAQGRWNLSDVLLNASHVQSAPTAQRSAGPKPRFPYIEATSGRVNVKLGSEKLPFSLTDADFALWLPSSQQWRVRLIGHPVRTDTNITDPGRLRIEGELRHAASAAAVPVNFTASWHDAPLGEATRILTGDDRGWRGNLNIDATLTGYLGDAALAGKITLGGLRRAEFFPAHPLDLQISCNSGFTLHPVTLKGLLCRLPDNAREPLQLRAETLHPQSIKETAFRVQASDVPARWALLWAALFSQRVLPDQATAGMIDVDLQRGPGVGPPKLEGTPPRASRNSSPAALASPSTTTWNGTVRVALPQRVGSDSAEASAPANVLVWEAQASNSGAFWPSFRLAPALVVLGPGSTVTLGGSLGHTGYTFTVNGNAAPAALLQPARYLPQLADGVEAILPPAMAGTTVTPVQITCSRSWGAAQTCTEASSRPATPATETSTGKAHRRSSRRR